MAIEEGYAIVGTTPVIYYAGGHEDSWAYTYSWDGNSWVEQEKLTPGPQWWGQQFACSVDLDGRNAVVGSTGHGENLGIGEVYIYGDGQSGPTPPPADPPGPDPDPPGANPYPQDDSPVTGQTRYDRDTPCERGPFELPPASFPLFTTGHLSLGSVTPPSFELPSIYHGAKITESHTNAWSRE